MKRFEDVVNVDFFDKYLPLVKPAYGVMDKDGKVRYSVLEEMFRSLNGGDNPNRFVYALIHGIQNLLPAWNTPPKYRGKEEAIYKECLDTGKTWKEVLGYKIDEDIVL